MIPGSVVRHPWSRIREVARGACDAEEAERKKPRSQEAKKPAMVEAEAEAEAEHR